MFNTSLELEYKHKLYFYIQLINSILGLSVFIYSSTFLPINDYNFYFPDMALALFIISLFALALSRFIDKKLKYTTYLISTLQFFAILYFIYTSRFAFNTLFFWLTGFIILTYFFTSLRFSIIQIIISICFLFFWPNSFLDKELTLYSFNATYDRSFFLSSGAFMIFITSIFFFSERIKRMYYKVILEASQKIKGEASFAIYNPNPVFEYSRQHNLVPKNHHAREFVLTSSNIEIDRLMQYSLDVNVTKNKRMVRCMLGENHFLLNLVPVEDKVNLYLTNITSLIKAQYELEEKEQYNRAIIDAMPGFVSWVDSDLNYLGVNNHLCEFFDAKPSDFIGKRLGTVHSSEDDALFSIAEKLFKSSEDFISVEIQYIHNGVNYWNFVNLKKYNHGEAAVIVSVDISNLKQAEEQLTQEQKKAEASAKLAAFGEMSAGIAHEINNPLAIIKGAVHRLNKLKEKGQLSDDKFEELVEKTYYGIDRVTKIISGMKNLSRDGQNDAFEIIKFSEIIDDSLVLLSKKCEVNNIELLISDYKADLKLYCQRVQISQVLVILINNSIDAIKKQKTKWIKIEIYRTETHLLLSIIDSGGGIDSDVTEDIFKPFFTTKKVGKGTGLGLSLASKIIKSHQGEFSLDTQNPHTKFDIIIPLNKL